MPRNGESGIPASLVARHGHVVSQLRPNAPTPPSDFTLNERLAYRALAEIRMALGMSVHDTPEQLAEAVTELVNRKGPTDTHAVHVRIGVDDHAVNHRVANEIARLRDAARGSLVLVQMALDLRDEAVDVVDELVQTKAPGVFWPEGLENRAREVRLERHRQKRAAAGEG